MMCFNSKFRRGPNLSFFCLGPPWAIIHGTANVCTCSSNTLCLNLDLCKDLQVRSVQAIPEEQPQLKGKQVPDRIIE